MGNGASMSAMKTIFLDIDGRTEKISISSRNSAYEIQALVCRAAGVSQLSQVTLKTQEGSLISCSPGIPVNTPNNLYKVTVVKKIDDNDTQALASVFSKITDQLNKAFRVEEMRSDLDRRLNHMEKRLETEGLKNVEIEKCKKDITDIRDQIWHQQKMVMNNERDNRYDENGIIQINRWKKDVPAYPKYTLSEETVAYLKKPTFDIWHWEPNEMLSLLEHMYHELDLVHEFNMNPITLKRWLLCIQANYRNNPFHNFRHCFCVSQMMYGLIHLCKLNERLPREDLVILLTAAICHDLDHPGYNNTYQINARTELAIRYNDISPLENHHCAVAFQILNNPETNIFSNVDSDNFKRIRQGMTMLILATDMARHSEIVENLKKRLNEGFDFSKKDHTDTLKMVLIKCCDISNEVRPMEVSEPWVDCLLEEYFNQSDREKQEGLPVAPFMDREKVTKPTAQIGFIKFVLIPMFEVLAKLFPVTSDVLVQPLRDALSRYESMKSEIQSTTASSDKK